MRLAARLDLSIALSTALAIPLTRYLLRPLPASTMFSPGSQCQAALLAKRLLHRSTRFKFGNQRPRRRLDSSSPNSQNQLRSYIKCTTKRSCTRRALLRRIRRIADPVMTSVECSPSGRIDRAHCAGCFAPADRG